MSEQERTSTRRYTKRQFATRVIDRETGTWLIGTVKFRPDGRVHWVRPALYCANNGLDVLTEDVMDRLVARLLRLAALVSERKRRRRA